MHMLLNTHIQFVYTRNSYIYIYIYIYIYAHTYKRVCTYTYVTHTQHMMTHTRNIQTCNLHTRILLKIESSLVTHIIISKSAYKQCFT